MPRYLVTMPVVGYIEIEVEAQSKEEAWKVADSNIDVDDIVEWDTVKHVSKGNVCFHPRPHFEVEEI